MDISVITTDEEWSESLSGFNNCCISSTFGFHKLYEKPQKAKGCMGIVAKTAGSSLFYPFLLQEVPYREGMMTITSPYGFTGPMFNGSKEELASMLTAVRSVMKERGIVAEFLRIAPLKDILNKNMLVEAGYKVIWNRKLPFYDSDSGCFKETCSMTKRAEREECRFAELEMSEMDIFRELYISTMELNGATDFFFYDDDYFSGLGNINNRLGTRIFGLKKDGILIASSAFLVRGDYALYHLGCNNRTVPGAADMVLRRSCKKLLDDGIRLINFTGGRTTDERDSLLRFKSRFANQFRPFYIGFNILDIENFEGAKLEYNRRNATGGGKMIPWS